MQATIPYTSADHVLLAKAKELFAKLYKRRQLVRLLGVRFSHLVPGNYQINLFDDTEHVIKLYQAIDSVKHQYGESLIIRAAGFDAHRKDRPKLEKGLQHLK